MKSVHHVMGIGLACCLFAFHASPAAATTCSDTGGCSNTVSSDYSGVLSGDAGSVGTGADWAVVAGGHSNGIGAYSDYSAIAAGYSNDISSYGPYSFIGGGENNYIYGGLSGSLGYANTILGGNGNGAMTRTSYAYIGGGSGNAIYATNGLAQTIAGGAGNRVNTGDYATIGGGWSNSTSGDYAVVIGGEHNTGSAMNAAALGGYENLASGSGSVTVGGTENTASGSFSFAAGRWAKADQNGCFVWADSINHPQTCTFYPSGGSPYSVIDSFVVRATGGVEFITNFNASNNPIAGVYLGAGGSTWSLVSDRNKKHGFQPVDAREALRRVMAMPVTTWRYKAEASGARHMGPMAQDFYAAFGLGEDDEHVTSIDEDGVAMAAIQGLYAEAHERGETIRALNDRVASLQKSADEMEKAAREEIQRAEALEARLARIKARLALARGSATQEKRP